MLPGNATGPGLFSLEVLMNISLIGLARIHKLLTCHDLNALMISNMMLKFFFLHQSYCSHR